MTEPRKRHKTPKLVNAVRSGKQRTNKSAATTIRDSPEATTERVRYGTFPKPKETIEFPYALTGAFRNFSFGQLVMFIVNSVAWRDIMLPALEQWEASRHRRENGQRKTCAPRYTAAELETVELFRRVSGCASYKDARDLLASDRSEFDRQLLGLTESRHTPTHGDPRNFRLPGIPSEATVSRYRTFIGTEARRELWTRFLTALRNEWMELSEDKVRIAYLDGFDIRVSGQCPYPNTAPVALDENGKLLDTGKARPVTVPDGGYRKAVATDRYVKGGHGFSAVAVWDEDGVPLAHTIKPIQTSEMDSAVLVMENFKRQFGEARADAKVGVLSADGGFSSDRVRQAIRNAGFIENIHRASHSKKPSSQANARKKTRKTYNFGHTYNKWRLNGHHEISCECGSSRIERTAWRDADGAAKVTTRARCSSCGNLTVTSGRWRISTDHETVVRATNSNDPGTLGVGNPLTFNDRAASAYGRRRWSHNEGVHGVLKTHYKLNKKRRYRNSAEVELEAAIVFSCMVGLALANRRQDSAPALA